MSDLPTGVREQTAHAVETEMFVCGEHGVQWLMAVEGIYQDETVHIVSRLKEPSALGNQWLPRSDPTNPDPAVTPPPRRTLQLQPVMRRRT